MSDESKVFYLELVFLLFGFVIAYTICYRDITRSLSKVAGCILRVGSGFYPQYHYSFTVFNNVQPQNSMGGGDMYSR